MPKDKTLFGLCAGGYAAEVKDWVQEDASEVDRAMAVAAQHGQQLVVDVLLNAGANRYSWGLEFAAKHGHMELVKIFLELLGEEARKHVSLPMDMAAYGGHYDIMRLLIDTYGAVPTKHTLFQATWGNKSTHRVCVYLRDRLGVKLEDANKMKTKLSPPRP